MKTTSFFRDLTFLLLTLSFVSPVSAVGTTVSNVNSAPRECVVLLHGLARTSNTFIKMKRELMKAHYVVINVDYPSRHDSIEALAYVYISPAIDECHQHHSSRIHFVTHSMGGILVRAYLARQHINELGNVVMLSPPNQGSELIEQLRVIPGFELFSGPAADQIGASTKSLANTLGPVDYPVGVIAGNKSFNPFLSWIIPGEDDGKVSTERAKVIGMTDYLVVPHSHPFIMNSDMVIRQTIHFLEAATFEHLR